MLVIAVDVGHGQMDAGLRADPRVTCLEGLNARAVTLDHLGGVRPELVVCDVSFISLTLALPPALDLAQPGPLLVGVLTAVAQLVLFLYQRLDLGADLRVVHAVSLPPPAGSQA